MATRTSQDSKKESTFSLIGNRKLRQIYSTMLQYRILEAHARKAFGGKPSMRGNEAALVAAAIDLLPEDALAIADGIGIAGFLKQAPLKAIFGRLHQAAAEKSKKKHRRTASAASGDAAQAGIATGIALARSKETPGGITLAFLSNVSGHAETFAFARIHKLPIIYVCLGADLDEEEAQSYGFPAIPVDSNDAVAVYRVAYECILRARQGGGPSMLACTTFPVELSEAKSQDPLRNMERYLTGKGLFTEAWKQKLIQAFENEVKQALAVAKKADHPQRTAGAFAHLFSL